MMNRPINKRIIFLICLFLLGLIILCLINWRINQAGKNICDKNNLYKQAALILGARVYTNGQMSDVFRDRVETALSLYQAGQVDKILVSGDHGQIDYDEVNTAKEYLLGQSVKSEDIFLDHAGFDTYDSLYRARDIFQAESLVVITQNFHLPRALYIGEKLGLDLCGMSADKHIYQQADAMERREFLAKVKAWFNIFFHSQPKYLGTAIPLSGNGQETWD